MDFDVPGRLHSHSIPVADVVAFTVHAPAQEPAPAPEREIGRRKLALVFARLALAILTGRIGNGETLAVSDENPLDIGVHIWVAR